MSKQIFLASSSPRRQQLLQQLGFECAVRVAPIDETPQVHENTEHYVLRMAIEKNQAARQCFAERKIAPWLSADTCVALQGKILGKPENAQQAFEILRALSGSVHQVLTAVCVHYRGQTLHAVQRSDVHFKPLHDDEIHRYIATGEPMDKAGAYGIQGLGGLFVQHISGSFTGIMGLPVFETIDLLACCGAPIPPFHNAHSQGTS